MFEICFWKEKNVFAAGDAMELTMLEKGIEFEALGNKIGISRELSLDFKSEVF